MSVLPRNQGSPITMGRELMLEAEWLEHVDRLESSLILETLEQSRVLASDLG